MKKVLLLRIEDSSHVGEARRLAASMCRLLNFSEADTGKISLVATEMAMNLSKHSHGGQLLMQVLECGRFKGLEMLSIDKGPGMADVGRGMYNGFSTSGSPGTGLGAILRNSSEFDIYSEKAKGTVVLSKYCPDAAKGSSKVHPLKYGAVCLPAKGEEVCGDGWAVEQTEQRCLILVVDGVGHGIEASEASREAVKLLYKNKTRSPSAIVEAIHAGLISTRGAAVAVAEIDHVNRVVHYCGIGNISGRIVAGDMEKNMVSHNGTAGHNARKIQEFTQPWDDECLLIMHSDGLSARWNLADYPMLLHKHPSIIAGVLYRDFARGMDDATVVAAKKQRG